MMTADSDNNVFGRTLNPYHLNLTAGGSSGGEGALVGLRGSILGVGTDIAGSIRIPAFCNGIVGFRPSARRIPYGGQTGASRPGGFGILPSAGPLCTSVRDAEYFMKAVLACDPWTLDEGSLTAPWRQVDIGKGKEEEAKSLRLGFILEDVDYPLHPPVLRNVKSAISKIEAAGHKIVSLDILAHTLADASKTAFTKFAMDPQKTPFKHIARSGEPIVPSIPTTSFAHLEDFKPTLDDVFDLNVKARKIMAEFRHLIVRNRLDGIDTPVNQATAVPHATYGFPIYTVLANLLDYPACTVPFGHASKALDAEFIRNVPYVPAYDPDAVEGAPTAIQIMGRNMCDEETLMNTRIIADILNA